MNAINYANHYKQFKDPAGENNFMMTCEMCWRVVRIHFHNISWSPHRLNWIPDPWSVCGPDWSPAWSKKGQPLTEEGATAPISIELLLRRRVSSPDVTGRCRRPLPPSGRTQVAPKVNRFSLSRTFFNPQLMIPQSGPICQTLRVALVIIYRKRHWCRVLSICKYPTWKE